MTNGLIGALVVSCVIIMKLVIALNKAEDARDQAIASCNTLAETLDRKCL